MSSEDLAIKILRTQKAYVELFVKLIETRARRNFTGEFAASHFTAMKQIEREICQ